MTYTRILRLRIFAGKATSGPPLGPVLGQFKIPMMEFCKDFNERTQHISSDILVSVCIFLYPDSSYTYTVSFPTNYFILKYVLHLDKGNGFPNYYIIDFNTNKKEILSSNYAIISPQMLYEISNYYVNHIYSYLSIRSYFNTLISSLKSIGLHVILKRKF